MTRGRKPETAEQQAEKGAPGKRLTASEAQIARSQTSPKPQAIGDARPPKWLKRSRKATEIWNELTPLLLRLNLLTELDANSFARYCRYVAEWIVADQTVQKEGVWFDTIGTNGEATKKRHPAWQAMQDIEKLLRDIEPAFGMRPDARYKIMRDQAVAQGLLGSLPLWGGQPPQKKDEPQAPAAEASQTDIVSILQSFDSAPPERLN